MRPTIKKERSDAGTSDQGKQDNGRRFPIGQYSIVPHINKVVVSPGQASLWDMVLRSPSISLAKALRALYVKWYGRRALP